MKTRSALLFATAAILVLTFAVVELFSRLSSGRGVLSSHENESKESDFASKWILGESDANAFELKFLLSSLGLFSAEESIGTGSELGEVRDLLGKMIADSGGSLSVLSLKELNRSLDEVGTSSGIVTTLVTKNGVLYNLLGTYEARGNRYCQVSQGSSLYLMEPDYFSNLGVKEVWLFRKDVDKGTPISIGSNLLVVDKICHNFGETPPLSPLTCSFELRNESAQTMIIEPPQTSCGCVAALLDKSQAIYPGDSFRLKFDLQSGTAISFRQKVTARVYMEETGEAKTVDLFIVGNHPESMSISPKEINFGDVEPGERRTKEVVLKEALTDRFSILDVRCDDEFISWKVDSEDGVGGLKKHRLHITLAIPAELESSERRVSSLIVSTDSDFIPEITIPITYAVPPYFAAAPSVISFGTVEPGVSVTSKVAFTSRDGSEVTYKFVNLPDTITQKEDVDGVLLTFTPSEGQKGVVEETLEVEVAAEKRSERLLLKCVAFAR